MANSAWVCAIAIFIIATLVTDAEFLQNLAAISWDRSWWRVAKATEREILEKREDELAQQEVHGGARRALTGSEQPGPLPVQKSAQEFETAVLEALPSLFGMGGVRRGVALVHRSSNLRLVLDAVGRKGSYRYIIEIKYSDLQIPIGLKQLQYYLSVYADMLSERRGQAKVRGILIVPAPGPPEATLIVPKQIAVLKFDATTGTFVNREEILAWMATTTREDHLWT